MATLHLQRARATHDLARPAPPPSRSAARVRLGQLESLPATRRGGSWVVVTQRPRSPRHEHICTHRVNVFSVDSRLF